MYLLYSLALGIGLVLLSPWFLIQGLRRGKYLRSLRGRLGVVPEVIVQAAQKSQGNGGIWIHAVSVGEAIAAMPLARGLRERFPNRPVYVSTTTETGQTTARERLGKWAAGVFYLPLDIPWMVRRAIEGVRPSLIVIVETEIWPNFLREAARGGIPVVFVNARISARSLPKYERVNRLFGNFLRKVLREPVLFLAQSSEDAARLVKIGAPSGKVIVMGNMKYDIVEPEGNAFSFWLKQQGGKERGRPVLVAGSVMAGEESAVLEAFDDVRKDWPRALLVLAPRKTEQFDDVAKLAEAGGRILVRRSQLQSGEELKSGAEVILLDTIGELAPVYSAADVVFVGGSLVATGGHNLVEPAACGKAPAFGPHMENFSEMAEQFVEAHGGKRVVNGAELGQFWRRLLADDDLRAAMGRGAASILEANRGATEKTLEAISILIAQRAGPE
jgi:3-deoxy-D-manno-octulosonic-acid transferase